MDTGVSGTRPLGSPRSYGPGQDSVKDVVGRCLPPGVGASPEGVRET